MARKPGYYKKSGWFVTSSGGIQHQKLCRVAEGERKAELALARLMVKRDEAEQRGATSPGPGIPLTFSPKALSGQLATVTEAHDDFLDIVLVKNGPETLASYRDAMVSFEEKFGERPISSLTYDEGFKFKDWLRKEKPWKKGNTKMIGVGVSRVNKIMQVCKILLNWCAKPSRQKKCGVTFNPWSEIKRDAEESRERLLTPEEFKALVANCSDGNVSGGKRDFQEVLGLLYTTTMRPQELRKLKWQYIFLDRNVAIFPAAEIKTRRRREITLIDAAKAILLERKTRAEARGLPLQGYVFPAPSLDSGKRCVVEAGENIQQSHSISQRFRRLFDKCVRNGLIEEEKSGEPLVLYSYRHNRITTLFVEGNDFATVMRDAGHLVPSTTEKYLHLSQSAVADKIRSSDASANLNADTSDGLVVIPEL